MSGREVGWRLLGEEEVEFFQKDFLIGFGLGVAGEDEGRVLEVMEGRDMSAGEMLLATLPDEVKERIEAVCIDMSGSNQGAIENELPQAAIVHDRFHISAHLNDGEAKVHREENARLQKQGDERLKGTQRLFGFDPDHFNDDQALRFKECRDADLKTARAWAIKEMFRRFWDYRYEYEMGSVCKNQICKERA